MLSRRSLLNQTWRAGTGLAGAALLTACGFQLRKAPELAFSTMYMNIAEASVFGQLLKRNLKTINNLEVITDTREIERAQVILELTQEAQEKVILSKSSTGTVREYVLRYRVPNWYRSVKSVSMKPPPCPRKLKSNCFTATCVLIWCSN